MTDLFTQMKPCWNCSKDFSLEQSLRHNRHTTIRLCPHCKSDSICTPTSWVKPDYLLPKIESPKKAKTKTREKNNG